MAKNANARTKRNYREKRPDALFTFVQNTLTEMALFPLLFPNPKVALAVLLIALNKTIGSFNKHLKGGPLDTAVYEKDLENLLTLVDDQADYVDDIADGDVAIILESGFDAVVPDRKTHKSDETYTQGVSGQVKAVLKKINGATNYLWQYCEFNQSGEQVWILADCTRYAKYNYNGLTPGTTYLFRYCPTVNNTLGVFSNPYKMIVT